MIHLEPRHIECVKSILDKFLPGYRVSVYGSRAHGRRLRKFSDLDLAIMADEPLPFRTHAQLEIEFEESNLPIRVDVLDWAATDESFRKIIEKDLVPLDAP